MNAHLLGIQTTATNTAYAPVFDRASIERMVRVVSAMAARPEPIAEWMLDQGCPPATHTLLLPETMRAELGPFPPRYVKFTSKVDRPTLMQNLLPTLP